jgi:hypothetical protein
MKILSEFPFNKPFFVGMATANVASKDQWRVIRSLPACFRGVPAGLLEAPESAGPMVGAA